MAFVFSGTATTTASVLSGQPTISDFTNGNHSHSNAVGAGTVSHSVLTSLSADNHTQYAMLAGRAGGQTLQGGTNGGNPLNLVADGVGGGTISLGTDGGSVRIANNVTGSLSFFAAAAVSQIAVAALVDSSGGTPAGTVVAAGGAYVQADENNFRASITAKLNELRNALNTYGQIG